MACFNRKRLVVMLRVTTLCLHSKETHKPASLVIYLAHKPCTGFAGKDIGKLVMETLTDPGGLNLSKKFVLANNCQQPQCRLWRIVPQPEANSCLRFMSYDTFLGMHIGQIALFIINDNRHCSCPLGFGQWVLTYVFLGHPAHSVHKANRDRA